MYISLRLTVNKKRIELDFNVSASLENPIARNNKKIVNFLNLSTVFKKIVLLYIKIDKFTAFYAFFNNAPKFMPFFEPHCDKFMPGQDFIVVNLPQKIKKV